MAKKRVRQTSSGDLGRRDFLKGALSLGTLAFLQPGVLASVSAGRSGANDKLNVAFVGIGNRGADLVREFNRTGLVNPVAFCDTQMGAAHTQGILKEFPGIAQFRDFRVMHDRLGRAIDAVCVATPDHSHFAVCMLAMSQRKHVYVEKPLAHSFRQMELMIAAERRYRVACQMGNQGHSEGNYFQFKAWTEAGIIRNVTRITAFMNSARRWHGMTVPGYMPEESLIDSIDWDCWLATARRHPFSTRYLNGDWRGWYDFGAGALGDWGAHIFDTAHEFLDLGLPAEVEPVLIEGHSPYIFPQASTVAFRFPNRGSRPPVELTWYDGQRNLPPLPREFGGVATDPNIPPPSSGSIDVKVNPPGKVIYGEGLTFKGGSHGSTLEIIPAERARDLKLPEVPKSPSNHFVNFLRACRGEERCRSNFAVAGPLCQAMAIGVIAQQVNAKVVFDRRSKRITNHRAADELLDGPPPPRGWEQFYKM